MASMTDIGSLISQRPGLHGGRPCTAGTGVTVRRIAVLHNMGEIPEEIVRNFGHLSLAQVHAALAYYYANKAGSVDLIKIYIDEDAMDSGLVIALRSRGVTVFTPLATADTGMLDEEHGFRDGTWVCPLHSQHLGFLSAAHGMGQGRA